MGFYVKVYDTILNLAALTGTNREYIQNVLPHLNELLVDTLDAALADSEVIVVGNNSPEYAGLADTLGSNQRVFDLVGIAGLSGLGERYDGINW
jgi:GDP-mannose 6-dehydrogenase